MTEREYLVALSTFTPFGPMRLKLLMSYFKKASKVWKAGAHELSELGINKKTVESFVKHRDAFEYKKYSGRLEKLGIKTISIFEENYPENLREIEDAPFVIYVRGKLEKIDSRAIAIIGSRLMTSYGKEVASKFAGELANFGITIVSGLALGVDAQAQKSALVAGGRTIAVLASGLDIISPASNTALALELIKNHGALVSEYPLGHIPFPSDFAVRNRLISGLSKGVLVVEAKIKSGTFYTVNAALSQGRPVFAVPGPIYSPTSEAPHYLIQNGAKLTTDVGDIMSELNMQVMVNREETEKILPSGPVEEKIISLLEKEPIHLDEIVRISGITTSEVSARLTFMEMKGMVKNLGGGMYRVAK